MSHDGWTSSETPGIRTTFWPGRVAFGWGSHHEIARGERHANDRSSSSSLSMSVVS